ncbi:MAG: NAD(P)-dependent glycerol-3-phosphate dehydrogenase [Bacilli bacterium]|nr:NAD(P)-dependent glycerol-3-phosphate dehydrogenase [Bacilli bacterium]
MKITVLGSGAWGTALTYALSKKEDNDLLIYGRNPAEVDDINKNHKNTKYFEDVILPSSIKATTDPSFALKGRDILLLATPSSQINNIVELIANNCDTSPLIINVIKGFDPNTGEGIAFLIEKALKGKVDIKGVVSLVGPSFAHDVIHDELTAICAVSEDKGAARLVQELFSSPSFRVYVQTDAIGAEIGAGMKNIIAIASGTLEGLGYHDNTRSALITRGLAEITRFGLAKGAHASTFLGLTGVGDLTLTCSSHRSRNYTLGLEIGKENLAAPVLERNTKTVEGVLAAKTIHFEAKRIGVEVPITDAVYEVLYEGKTPSKVVKQLMVRALKEE